MSTHIDPDLLESIAQEARQCFLEEDAPEYLATLQSNLTTPEAIDYGSVLRAAHSLKGGAGLAQLPSLGKLAHKLEDLYEAMRDNRLPEPESAMQLAERGVEEIAFVLDEAATRSDAAVDPALLEVLEQYLANLPTQSVQLQDLPMKATAPFPLVKAALEVDLEDCLTRVEDLLKQEPDPDPIFGGPDIEGGISEFVEECSLLAETLSLDWLAAAAQALRQAVEQPQTDPPLPAVISLVIEHIREQRAEFLQSQGGPTQSSLTITDPVVDPLEDSFFENSSIEGDFFESSSLEEDLLQGSSLDGDLFEELSSNEAEHKQVIEDQIEALLGQPDPPSPPVVENNSTETQVEAPTPQAQIRIPLSRLEDMTDQVGELIIRYERLAIQQQQLKQASHELQRLSQQFQPLRDQVQLLYDQMSTQHMGTRNGHGSLGEFDPLELDRYTALHTSLQNFEELITRIQETRSDVDLVNRELLEDVEQGRRELDALYSNVTRSRLVAFQTLAQRFIPRVNSLARRCGKRAALMIVGGEVLVDQVLLEQLQTPFMHLLNNAVDHGLETPEERFSLGKPESGSIKLEAALEGNQVVISFQDDGKGIDLNRVYRKAIERKLCPSTVEMAQLTRDSILNFIFQPGFSTAAQVSDVSGRGVGLDVVRGQIAQLRGNLEVDTLPGQGTTFTVRLPLGLNLLPLILCQSQRQIIGIPATSVLEIMAYRDFITKASESKASESTDISSGLQLVPWRGEPIPLISLTKLLPYAQAPADEVHPRVVIVLSGSETPVAISVDALLGERQMVLKPFDDTIVVPSYVAGCTILGTGEVVPVMLPYQFGSLLKDYRPTVTSTQSIKTSVPTILIAEDSVATRRAVEKILSQAGYTIIACRDGQEALDELRQRQGDVDLIITDIEMPRITGFELLQSIRAHSHWHALPVALLTSRSGERHQQRAISLGATAYMSKPVDPRNLLKTVRSLLTQESPPVNSI